MTILAFNKSITELYLSPAVSHYLCLFYGTAESAAAVTSAEIVSGDSVVFELQTTSDGTPYWGVSFPGFGESTLSYT